MIVIVIVIVMIQRCMSWTKEAVRERLVRRKKKKKKGGGGLSDLSREDKGLLIIPGGSVPMAYDS